MSPLLTSLMAFAIIFAGSFVGMFIRNSVPEHHLSADTKDVVRLGTGLIGTIAGLVLGLLISAANGTYDTQSAQVKQVIAGIVLLDRTLELYGREADSARKLLRQSVGILADRIWRENSSDPAKAAPFVESASAESLYDEILKMKPGSEAQRLLQAKALDATTDLAKARLLLFARAGGSIPVPFLVVLISWLTIIFASFSLFAEHNATSIAALCIFALSASAALFLILELSQPFTGLMMISEEPLRGALAPLGS
jgi:hypothetical protein